jgi:hypothetical protein
VENGQPQEWSTLTAASEIRMPPWLFSKADQPNRRYSWFVTVVRPETDGQGGQVNRPLGESSVIRTLTWN